VNASESLNGSGIDQAPFLIIEVNEAMYGISHFMENFNEVPDGASPEVSKRLRQGALPLEQLPLLRVQLTVLLLPPLTGDVVTDRLLTAVTPDGVDVVAARPERAAPELLLHRRNTPEDLTGRDAGP